MRIGVKTIALLSLGLCGTIPAYAQGGRAPAQHHSAAVHHSAPIHHASAARHTSAVHHASAGRAVAHAGQAISHSVRTFVQHNRVVVRHDHPVVVVHRHDGFWRDGCWVPPIYDPVVVAPNNGFDIPLALNQLPPAVLATAQNYASGPLETADYIRRAGCLFYDVHAAGPYGTTQNLRIDVYGNFMGFV